ncbi:MAG TPA: hypothetical protein VNQ77_12220 [Frankiaceae bacterium]|nr:hypothetical protein [Frankiaceae bacterium]
MRKLLLAALVAVPLAALAPNASAVCDPDFRPICVSECLTQVPDVRDPLGHLQACPR